MRNSLSVDGCVVRAVVLLQTGQNRAAGGSVLVETGHGLLMQDSVSQTHEVSKNLFFPSKNFFRWGRAGKAKVSQGRSHGPADGPGGLTGQRQSDGSTQSAHAETHGTDKNSCWDVAKKRWEPYRPARKHVHMTATVTRGAVTHTRSRQDHGDGADCERLMKTPSRITLTD